MELSSILIIFLKKKKKISSAWNNLDAFIWTL